MIRRAVFLVDGSSDEPLSEHLEQLWRFVASKFGLLRRTSDASPTRRDGMWLIAFERFSTLALRPTSYSFTAMRRSRIHA